MNLFNANIGDIFYVLKTVKGKSGWEHFFVAQKVTKVTYTQITLENGLRYMCSTGKGFGHSCQLLWLGMFESTYTCRRVKDETKEFLNFVSQNRDAQIV